ncbi:MAG: plastocyanin/azurin family copper-binding protein [Pirellulales bacterium]|nr:plastocyanin/azurin family copper-binding protein [Pirellulales bacterium]
MPRVLTAQQSEDPALVDELLRAALEKGNPARGAVVYASPTSACLSCHKVGQHGGEVGPELSQVGAKQKPRQIVESVLWPAKVVQDPYKAIAVLTSDGRVIRGFKIRETEDELEIRDAAQDQPVTLAQEDVEAVQDIGTLMPDGLLAKMPRQDQRDLIAFLLDLGKHDRIGAAAVNSLLSHAHGHHPATFDPPREPLQPPLWPSWQADVNRDRVYDFYAKQARHFRDANPRPTLLAEFPGLDGGSYGHWGNQSEPTWADGRWNEVQLGSLLSGVFHGDGVRVARGICVQLSDGTTTLSACFDPDTLSYAKVWQGGFVKFSDVRHGFMHGLKQDGAAVEIPAVDLPYDSNLPKEYLGLYRHGKRVIFAYRVGGVEYLDAATVSRGEFQRIVAPRDLHPDRQRLAGGPPQWPQTIVTGGTRGAGTPYAVDKIELPKTNPWNALLYCGGHDFLSDGTAIVCTMQGDVWSARGLDGDLDQVRWRRIASGLHQALGLVVHDDQIYVMGRDQLTRLHDFNGDGEADFYECFSRALETSFGGHDFTCGLWRDQQGRFYTVSGKQGVMRITADGRGAEVLATGLRNSDGLGLLPDGTVTMPSSEGDWMPASMVAAIRPGGPVLNRLPGKSPDTRHLPFFGRPGTHRTQPPEVPMLYLPRGLDNSSGGQAYIDSDRWGPVQGQLVHLSFGAGRAFLLLRDELDGWIQGAAVPIAGEFASGAHRARFNPVDGQLYVSGMAGWGTYTTDDGCFQRVRFTGGSSAQLPVGFHVHENGIRVDFSQPLDQPTAGSPQHHFAQAWNYRYSGAYGSPEYSSRQLGLRGHDVLSIESATVLNGGRSVFLEIPDLQPVNQLHLMIQSSPQQNHDLFLTVHRLDKPFQGFDGYLKRDKAILPHPMLADLNRPIATARNPHRKAIQNARHVTIKAAKNLMFDQTRLRARPGEAIRLTFENPDAVPHNWALLKPGTLQSIGKQANRLVADPEAAAYHYVPKSDDVLVYTDVVEPYSKFTIYFRSPEKPGRYPYLCTFPGHWMVMNGELVVEE